MNRKGELTAVTGDLNELAQGNYGTARASVEIVAAGEQKQRKIPASRYQLLMHALGYPHDGNRWGDCYGAFYFLLWPLLAGAIDIIELPLSGRVAPDGERDRSPVLLVG